MARSLLGASLQSQRNGNIIRWTKSILYQAQILPKYSKVPMTEEMASGAADSQCHIPVLFFVLGKQFTSSW